MSGKEPANAPWGLAFLGRDVATWGKEGVGMVAIDPNICPAEGVCPAYTEHDDPSKPDLDSKIHLVIASFRDRLCPRTLYNAFTKAANPQRVYIRILQQIDPSSNLEDDADCWSMLCEKFNGKDDLRGGKFDCHPYRANVEIVSIDSHLAKGPCDARAKLSALIEHDYIHATDGKHRLAPVDIHDYCMQTDSHMDFNHDFDVGMIHMFHRAENDRAVLSTYVDPLESTDMDPKSVPHLCMITFTFTWRNWGTKLIKNAKKPKLTNLVWGAGLSFSKCHAELTVPYDPYLDNVFDGEETSRGIRFFTHGYDVYTPDKVLVTHDYEGHQGNPVVHTWGGGGRGAKAAKAEDALPDILAHQDMSFLNHIEEMRPSISIVGSQRVNVVMGVQVATTENLDPEIVKLVQFGKYGLGTERTLEQAYDFAGFDPVQHKMVGKNRCGNLKWVPYTLPPCAERDYCVAEALQRPIWNESATQLHETLEKRGVLARLAGPQQPHGAAAAAVAMGHLGDTLGKMARAAALRGGIDIGVVVAASGPLGATTTTDDGRAVLLMVGAASVIVVPTIYFLLKQMGFLKKKSKISKSL